MAGRQESADPVLEAAQENLARCQAELGVVEVEDFAPLCAKMILAESGSAQATWAQLMFKVLERTEGQNVVYHIVYSDPLQPSEDVPPLPELPGAETEEPS